MQERYDDDDDMHIINNSSNEIGGEVGTCNISDAVDDGRVDDNDEESNEIDDDIDASVTDENTSDSLLHVRLDCHRLSLVDVIEVGKEKIKDMDISTQRKNMKVLTECYDNFLLESFNKMMQDSNETNNFQTNDDDNHPTIISSFIVDFNKLKNIDKTNETNFAEDFNMLQER